MMKTNIYKKILILISLVTFALPTFAMSNKKPQADRQLASEEGKHAFDHEIARNTVEINDKHWGTLYIETADFHEPANYSVEIKVSVKCNDQSAVKNTINVPKKELLVHHKGICYFDSHKFDQEAGKLTIFYNEDSGMGDSYEELCNIAKAQDFEIKEICKKWGPRK